MAQNVMNIHKGDIWLIKLDDGVENLVGCITSIAPSFQVATSEVQSCREDFATVGSWLTYVMGAKSGEIALEGYVRMSGSWNPVRFFNALDTEKLLEFDMYPSIDGGTTPQSGGYRLTGNAYVTNLETSHPSDEVVTFSCTLLINGKPTKTLIP